MAIKINFTIENGNDFEPHISLQSVKLLRSGLLKKFNRFAYTDMWLTIHNFIRFKTNTSIRHNLWTSTTELRLPDLTVVCG